MLKGALIGFGVTIALILIPIVHFVTALPSPFIGGFIGGSRAQAEAHEALVIGLLMALMAMAPVLLVSGLLVLFDIASGGGFILVIAGVAAIYVGLLGSLGALIGGRVARRQTPS